MTNHFNIHTSQRLGFALGLILTLVLLPACTTGAGEEANHDSEAKPHAPDKDTAYLLTSAELVRIAQETKDAVLMVAGRTTRGHGIHSASGRYVQDNRRGVQCRFRGEGGSAKPILNGRRLRGNERNASRSDRGESERSGHERCGRGTKKLGSTE